MRTLNYNWSTLPLYVQSLKETRTFDSNTLVKYILKHEAFLFRKLKIDNNKTLTTMPLLNKAEHKLSPQNSSIAQTILSESGKW